MTDGGDGVLGAKWKLTEKTKQNMSKSRTGYKPTKEAIKNLSKSLKNRKCSDTHCVNISKSLLGNKRGLGYKHSPERLEKIKYWSRNCKRFLKLKELSLDELNNTLLDISKKLEISKEIELQWDYDFTLKVYKRKLTGKKRI